jgi:hypothetical protein
MSDGIRCSGEGGLYVVPEFRCGYNCWTAGERKGERVLTHLVIVSYIHDTCTRY